MEELQIFQSLAHTIQCVSFIVAFLNLIIEELIACITEKAFWCACMSWDYKTVRFEWQAVIFGVNEAWLLDHPSAKPL